jgi:hypothetical protein
MLQSYLLYHIIQFTSAKSVKKYEKCFGHEHHFRASITVTHFGEIKGTFKCHLFQRSVMRSALFWDFTWHRMVVSSQHIGTTYLSHLHESTS